jgi:hypothetical protein
MIALSEIYNRSIEVYVYSLGIEIRSLTFAVTFVLPSSLGLALMCFVLEPKHTIHDEYRTFNEPIRLSYHCSVHYNSIVDPRKPTPVQTRAIPVHLQPHVIVFFIEFSC